MKTHPREILIYYNPESSNDKKTVAHAQGVGGVVRSHSFSDAPSTNTSWKQILKSLDMHPKDLLNKAILIISRIFEEESLIPKDG